MNYSRRPLLATLLVSCLTALLLWLGTGAEAQSPPPVDLSDDFNDNSLDSTKWNINAPGSPAVVSEQGQVIQIALPPNTATYNGIGSKTTHDMRDKTMEVEVVQAPSHAGWVEHSIQVALDGSNYYLVGAGSGSIVFRSVVNGVQDQSQLNYDPVAFRFWGIRHDQATNKISLQTSPDGVNWTTRKRMTAGFSLSAVYFYVYAGAWGTGNSNPGVAKYDNFQIVPSSSRGVNVAHSLNGAFATASSTYSLSYQASSAINGDRKGVNWGNNGGWHDVPPNNTFPDWLQVDFEEDKTISEIDVFTVQDNYANPAEPTETMTFSLYGLSGFEVQYWNGTTWENISAGSVTGNNLVWRKFIFTPLTTSKIRVLTNASTDGYSRIVEVEAYTAVVHPLAARWRFDEGSGTTASDSSGNGSNGTVQAATWTAGQVAGALDFNGTNSLVNVTSSPQLTSVSNNFTLSFWANPRVTHQIDPETNSGFSGTSGQKYVVGPKWYNNGDAGAGISVGTNGISVYEHAAGYMPATLVYQATLSGWTHIVLVYKNKQPKLYVNGVLVRTGLTSPMNSVHIEPVYIGGMAYGYFNGMLDEMSIYKDSFTPADVQAMHSYQITYKGGTTNMEAAASATSSSIRLFKEVKGTDIANFGVGNMRDRGFGIITVQNMPASINQAYLYWHGSNRNTELNLGGSLIVSYFLPNNVQNDVPVSGTFIGKSADNLWLDPETETRYPNTVAWRADVTSLVNHGGPNKTYSLDNFNRFPSFNPNGASLIILYNDNSSGNNLDVTIYDGNDGNSRNAFDSDGWFAPLTNFDYGSGTATVDLHVADGQFHLDDTSVRLNNLLWLTGNHFQGFGSSALWDILNFNITSFVQPGTNNLTITSSPVSSSLDGLNLIVAVVRVPPVREVKSLTWETIDSNIDNNPGNGGGKRIFPDWQRPNDPVNRRRVRVKAETTMGQGQTVFFRTFDVDDPDTDTTFTVDPNGTAGNDNRGTPNLGTLSAAQATTDSNGVATVEFTTTMQPGDNFMAAASTDSNYLNGVFAVGTSLRDAAGNNLPTNKAKATPMLTVWRQLHMEVDSMGPVDRNKDTGIVTAIYIRLTSYNCPPDPPSTCVPDFSSHDLGIDPDLFLSPTIDSGRYDGGQGIITFAGNSYVTLDVSESGMAHIATPEMVTPTGEGSTFVLVDDDDYNDNDGSNLDGDEGEDINAIEGTDDEKNTFALMRNSDDPTKNIYAAAYIRPVYDGAGAPGNNNNQSNEIFFPNVPSNNTAILAQFSQGSEANENDAYWVAYVQLCYQGDETADKDVNSEFGDGGVTLAAGPSLDLISSSAQLEGAFSPGSLIFMETMRDIAVHGTISNARKAVVPHEVGHQFGIAGDNPFFSFGIMNPGSDPKFVPMHLSLLRWRVHSP